MPVSATDCGDLGALSVKVSAALKAPFADGLKPTVTVQVAFTTRLVPQVLPVILKLPVGPESPTALMLRTAEPVFLIVTTWAAAAVPTVVAG